MSIHWLGYAGTGLVIVAYPPQLTLLINERCSAGLSSGAYLIWSIAAVPLLAYAAVMRDPVYVALQSYQVASTTSISLLHRRDRGSLCEIHGGGEA